LPLQFLQAGDGRRTCLRRRLSLQTRFRTPVNEQSEHKRKLRTQRKMFHGGNSEKFNRGIRMANPKSEARKM
jgi:hypothetical protein